MTFKTEKFKAFISVKRNLIIIFAVFALAAGVQSLFPIPKKNAEGFTPQSRYNNYIIFERSFQHLTNQQDLYVLYPNEHWDLYKYTPTFSVLFGVFAMFPNWLGLLLWNLLNAFVLLFAVYKLPITDPYKKGLILMISLIELMTSMQNEQSNGLMAGLLIMAFAQLEKENDLWAALCIVLSAFVKLFGVVGLALYLFYPRKLKLAAYTALWTVVLFLLPLLFIDVVQYQFLFESYGRMLAMDHAQSYGYSVMGWLHSWFGLQLNKNLIVAFGALLFLLPLLRFKQYANLQFRQLLLASILIWIVIFNHKAESPTFIIAVSGVALWFVLAKKNWVAYSLIALTLILTILSPTDIFPSAIREMYVKPYSLKAFPCILVWGAVIWQMLTMNRSIQSKGTL